jgi:hypothetical protein
MHRLPTNCGCRCETAHTRLHAKRGVAGEAPILRPSSKRFLADHGPIVRGLAGTAVRRASPNPLRAWRGGLGCTARMLAPGEVSICRFALTQRRRTTLVSSYASTLASTRFSLTARRPSGFPATLARRGGAPRSPLILSATTFHQSGIRRKDARPKARNVECNQRIRSYPISSIAFRSIRNTLSSVVKLSNSSEVNQATSCDSSLTRISWPAWAINRNRTSWCSCASSII